MPKLVTAVLLLTFAVIARADDWAPGVPVDTPFPNIDATDQQGVRWTNQELLGKNGLVIFFNRSTSW